MNRRVYSIRLVMPPDIEELYCRLKLIQYLSTKTTFISLTRSSPSVLQWGNLSKLIQSNQTLFLLPVPYPTPHIHPYHSKPHPTSSIPPLLYPLPIPPHPYPTHAINVCGNYARKPLGRMHPCTAVQIRLLSRFFPSNFQILIIRHSCFCICFVRNQCLKCEHLTAHHNSY